MEPDLLQPLAALSCGSLFYSEELTCALRLLMKDELVDSRPVLDTAVFVVREKKTALPRDLRRGITTSACLAPSLFLVVSKCGPRPNRP